MTYKTTCLSPYRHPRGSTTDFGSRRLKQGTICGPRHNQGTNPNYEPVTLYRLAPKRGAVVTALLAARQWVMEKLTKLAAWKSSRI
ncbi:MAG TPA: hypothetical protein PLW35_14635 [Verrucomicrobiota bacterium]|nr:hypothetical protein [Verrucomicrobiota bacterium]